MNVGPCHHGMVRPRVADGGTSVRREALYNIIIEFGIPKKLVRLIKMCLTETYSRVRVVKNLSAMFTIRNGLKQGDALSHCFSILLWNMPLRGFT